MAAQSDEEFRVFVATFANPLARLAFLLTAGTGVNTEAATIDALARLRRNWHDTRTSGLPELLALDALVTELPHRNRRRPDSAPVARSAPPRHVPSENLHDGDGEPEDLARIRMILWELWQGLAPRDRLPLLFDDPSVAAPRLAADETPLAAGSARRLASVARHATDKITTELHTYPTAPRRATLLDEQRVMQLLRDALRERAAVAPDLVDVLASVARRAGALRRRGYAIAAAVVGILVAGALTAVHVSNPKSTSSTIGDSPSTFAGTADPSLFPAAEVDAEAWLRTGGFTSSTIVVPLWGGTDVASTRVVVLGLEAAGLAHGFAVDWYHDPGQAGSIDPNLYFSAHYLAPPGAPVPVAFPYATARIGVFAPRDAAKAALVVNGHAEPPVVLDTSGFASLDATFTTSSAAPDNIRVALYDAGGRLVHTLEVATPAPG